MILFGHNKKIRQLEEQIVNLQEELNDCRKYERRVKELEAELILKETYVEKVLELENKLESFDKQEDVKLREMELSIKNTYIGRINELEQKIDSYKKLEERNRDLERKVKSNNSAEQLIHELEYKLKEKDSLEGKVAKLEKELSSYERRENLEEEISELEIRYESLMDYEMTIKTDIIEANNEKQRILDIINDLGKCIEGISGPKKNSTIDCTLLLVDLNEQLQKKKDSLDCTCNELQEEIESLRTEKDKYWNQRKDEVRSHVMHEIYQAVFQTKSDAIRALSNDIDSLDLEKLKEDLDVKNHNYKQFFGKGLRLRTVLGFSLPIYEFFNEYLQMNINLIVKQMERNSWYTIKSKVLVVFENIKRALFACNLKFDDNFENVILDYVEAKYLVVSKQRYDKQKEQEERKAQIEYERAIKKALKDEEKAQEQLEKKQREIESATNQATISKLQEQIKNLTEALLNAKELRERAMSMAQQTKSGYVYIISNIGSFGENVYKIGMTRRLDPMDRISELSNASVPFPFDVHAFIYSQDAPSLEATLHHIFDSKKVNTVNYRKEYFRVTLDEIKAEVSRLGIVAEFQENPDAFQYRESLRRFSFI